MKNLHLIHLALILMVFVGKAWAQDFGPALSISSIETDEIQSVISAQITAFQQNDVDTAFTFAAPSIQQMFQTPEVFGVMVERGYGQIFRTLDYEFLGLFGEPTNPVQAVTFTGTDLTTVTALYIMEPQDDQSWRIAGVQLVRTDQQAL